MTFIKRLMACLVCLTLLLTGTVCAEEIVPEDIAPASRAIRFSVAFDMNADAYPEQDQAILGGIADMLNILSLEGVYTSAGRTFDLTGDFLLNGKEETRTGLHLYGLDSHWQLESSLLGDVQLKFNMLGYLEFAMKAYFHLNVPLQYIALCTSAYATDSAFMAMRAAWEAVFGTEQVSRVIAREDVLALAQTLASLSESDRAFEYWVKALTLELGYDEPIFEGMAALPEWVDGFLGDEGITVTVADGMETWITGDATLFTRTVDAWTLTLPETADGYLPGASWIRSGDTEALHIGVTMDEENDLLDISLNSAGLTRDLPLSPVFALTVDIGGEMLGAMAQHLRFEGTADAEGGYTLTQNDAVTGERMLTLRGTIAEVTPTLTPNYTPDELNGVDIFSVNDNSLAELMPRLMSPVINGMMPLLLELPASAYTSAYQLLSDSGILSLLMSGTGDGE